MMARESFLVNLFHTKRVSSPKFNYELFNYNNLNIRYWSWNYRGCWHQTCPPVDSN